MALSMIPLDEIDPSVFQSREKTTPIDSVKEIGVIEPIVVRPRGSRFEVISGHRRLATLRVMGKTSALCKVVDLSNIGAATALFKTNEFEAWSDYERGLHFKRVMEGCQLSERELAKLYGISHSTISGCISVVLARARVVTPVTTASESLFERTVTAHKVSETKKLPEGVRDEALKQVVENRLSTSETSHLVDKIRSGQSPDQAATEVVNHREAVKPEKFAAKKEAQRRNRHVCPWCKGGLIVTQTGEGTFHLTKARF